MEFILVEWVNEKPRQFSVCKKTDIADGDLRDLNEELLGTCTLIQWKRNEYMGRILRIGDEGALEDEADELASKEHLSEITPKKKTGTKASRKRKRSGGESLVKCNISDVLAALPNQLERDFVSVDELELTTTNPVSSQISELEDVGNESAVDRTDYKAKYKALKQKHRELKARYKKLRLEQTSDEMVELVADTGVRMKKSELDKMKLMSSQVTTYARNLFRYFFTPEELAERSLFGKKCKQREGTITFH